MFSRPTWLFPRTTDYPFEMDKFQTLCTKRLGFRYVLVCIARYTYVLEMYFSKGYYFSYDDYYVVVADS